MRVQDVAESLFALVDSESGEHGRKKVRVSLKRFLAAYGSISIRELKPAHLIFYKGQFVKDGLSPNTANDALTYTRRLLKHAWDIEAVAQPFRLGVLKNLPRPVLLDKAADPESLKTLLAMITTVNPNLARAMLLQFYGVLRPSEVPKILHPERYGSQWAGKGVCLIHGKTTRKTGELRPCLLSDAAIRVLGAVERKWGARLRIPNPLAYQHLCWKVGERLKRELPGARESIARVCGRDTLYPHRLRHAANQALISAGVAEEHRRIALGRVAPRVDRTYGVRPNCEAARNAVAVLADLLPPTVVGVSI